MDNKKINLFYDLIDQACMVLYDELKINYIEALIRVGNDLTSEINENMLSEDTINFLNSIYQKLNSVSFYNEEVRIGLELLIVKGFKHIGYSLDLMTPDAINYLISYLIRKLNLGEISVIDTALGTANLLNSIINFQGIEIIDAIGIENDDLLVRLSKVCCDLQTNGITIFYQNAANPILECADLIIGDLPSSFNETNDYTYLPYKIILQRLENLKDDGFFIYLINNDFFSQEKSDEFKNVVQKSSTLLGLFVIDEGMFKNKNIGKSILVGRKKVYESFDMLVCNAKMNSQDELSNLMKIIDKWILKL